MEHLVVSSPQPAGEATSQQVRDHDSQQVQARRIRPKKYKCPFCWVALSNTGQFKGHIRIHTGERPFVCHCGKSFTRNEELTRHKRIHTGLRPYVCPVCNKCFGRKDHLKKHQRTHEKTPANSSVDLSAEIKIDPGSANGVGCSISSVGSTSPYDGERTAATAAVVATSDPNGIVANYAGQNMNFSAPALMSPPYMSPPYMPPAYLPPLPPTAQPGNPNMDFYNYLTAMNLYCNMITRYSL